MTNQFVVINDETFWIDTLDQIDEAQAALIAADQPDAKVFVTPTDECSPDAYQNGQILFSRGV
jgi:hypothetical protein